MQILYGEVYLEGDRSHVKPMRWNEFQLITRNDARRITWIANQTYAVCRTLRNGVDIVRETSLQTSNISFAAALDRRMATTVRLSADLLEIEIRLSTSVSIEHPCTVIKRQGISSSRSS